jgi:hypothetical protein
MTGIEAKELLELIEKYASAQYYRGTWQQEASLNADKKRKFYEKKAIKLGNKLAGKIVDIQFIKY